MRVSDKEIILFERSGNISRAKLLDLIADLRVERDMRREAVSCAEALMAERYALQTQLAGLQREAEMREKGIDALNASLAKAEAALQSIRASTGDARTVGAVDAYFGAKRKVTK